MKRLLIGVLIMLCSLCASTVFAEDTATSTPSQGQTAAQSALSPQDLQQLKEMNAMLQELMAQRQPQPDPKAAPQAQQQQQKTIADVLDKALDLSTSFLAKTIEKIEKVAPTVWTVMVRQQIATGIGQLVVPWGLFVLVLFYFRIVNRFWKKDNIEDGSEEFWARLWLVNIIPTVSGFAAAAWGFVRLSDAFMMLYNPQYYAIKDLVSMVIHPGTGM